MLVIQNNVQKAPLRIKTTFLTDQVHGSILVYEFKDS